MPDKPNLLATLRKVVELHQNPHRLDMEFEAAAYALDWPALLAAVEANERMRKALESIVKHQDIVAGGMAQLSATRRIATDALNPPATGKEG